MIVKTQAVVLKIVPYSETSRIVTWLSKDYGKITTIIKGSQRSKSSFLGQYDLFYTCELLFYLQTYRGLHIVKECSPLKLRPALRSAWKSTACASYLSDLISRVSPTYAVHPELYHLLNSALDYFGAARPEYSCLFWFELKLMEIMGLAPRLNNCLKCNYSLNGRVGVVRRVFSCSRGGVYCPECAPVEVVDAFEIAPDLIGLLRFWQNAPTWRTAQASVCAALQAMAAENLLGLLLRYHMGVSVDSRNIAFDVLRITP